VLNMPISALDAHAQAPAAKNQGRRTRHPEAPQMVVNGHPIHVGLSMESPALRVLNDFLSAEECTALIEQATPRLQRAKTVDQAGKQQIDARRTSEGMFFTVGETPLVQRIEQRIASMLSMPVEHGEGLQILHYRPGQQYEAHYDWFSPTTTGSVLNNRGLPPSPPKAASASPAW